MVQACRARAPGAGCHVSWAPAPAISSPSRRQHLETAEVANVADPEPAAGASVVRTPGESATPGRAGTLAG